ncbi:MULTISPECIES: CpaF family protein [Halobacteriovorax]|uniref:CpaF family protein n=1 Tax=Halobacteriovorax vibrionivorans TaxID=2152716 RepID=A0ABY0IEM8_9BACT|nr:MULTISPECIES: ATPase, T2SS/T4P/T4SS family [Halobacteriovorax]AYF45024.1 type II/IV secretion system protein [Halobacteriovorax sp. BALOs_7]RZF21087.1 CpaF family protein [Halobacteriovorax vibrionivorans]TGD47027.1 CpaF family protein [Halobacteriovorax sp. Y22]
MTENSIWKMLDDLSTKRGISEIVINGPNSVFVERAGEFIGLNVNINKKDILDFATEVAIFNKKEFSNNDPILDGRLPDGSRVNIISEPFASSGTSITIRKYLSNNFELEKHGALFNIPENVVPFLMALMRSRKNILISGGTGSGKTTFMNMLLKEVDQGERIITIEDTIELVLKQPNSVRLEAGLDKNISMSELVKNTLRMRPDRIIVGEVRGAETFDMIQAMNTGHDGSMTSIHANSPVECLQRVESLFLMSGFDLPYHVVRRYISTAVDYIIQLGRGENGRRKVTQIMEVNSMEGNHILTTSVFETENDELIFSGAVPSSANDLQHKGDLEINYWNTL